MASSSSALIADDGLEDLPTAIAEQQRQLMAALTLESDLDLAFHLQLEEALAASLALPSAASSSSSSSPPPPNPQTDDSASASFPALQSAELSAFEQHIRDRVLIEAETRRMMEDLNRRMHDQKVAGELLIIPDDEWEEWGDDFEKPYGEGSSSGSGGGSTTGSEASDAVFRMYCKGWKSEEQVNGEGKLLAGVGVAICDPKDNLIFEVRKPLVGNENGRSRQEIEARALIEGLNAAIALDLKRIAFFCDYYPLYQYVLGRWPAKQRKVAVLIHQVYVLRKRFVYCNAHLVARNDVKFAIQLARDAIISQITSPGSPSECKSDQDLKEQCVICLEDRQIAQMFAVDPCSHRFCFSCMKQHVEVKLLHGIVPKCPHDRCKSDLTVSSCSKFLTPKLIEMMTQRIREASIPVSEKVYCPYPRCSALMSKSEISDSGKDAFVGEEGSGARKCLKCRGVFCIECKVPWHKNLTCQAYKKKHPFPPSDVLRLKSLAKVKLWRECIKCNHMIELAEGCYHMTCRCGYEFCYNCGAEWKDKKATCKCPLWDEDNIWLEDDRDEDSDEDEDDYDSYYSDEDEEEEDDAY